MHRIHLSLVLVLLLLLAACGGDDPDISVDETDTGDVEAEDDAGEDGDDEGDDAGEDADDEDGDDEGDPGPRPDPAEVEEPCADRQGEEMEAFLDVVAPVDGQQVIDSVDLVGCANVPEGTVRYRVVGDDGEVLFDDFTTAECGGPCVGEYRTVVDLSDVADDHDAVTLEVFRDDPAGDGGDADRTEVELVFE